MQMRIDNLNERCARAKPVYGLKPFSQSLKLSSLFSYEYCPLINAQSILSTTRA